MNADSREWERLEAEPSATEPQSEAHPAALFLERLGLNVSTFPVITFRLEINDPHLHADRLSIPLRLPEHPQVYFESLLRVVRVLEIPKIHGSGHRRYFECEWTIGSEAIEDLPLHPALSVLAAEVECAACRDVFAPEPEIINESSIRLVCAHCMHHWSVAVAPLSPLAKKSPLLLDLFQSDKAALKKILKTGSGSDSSAFPFSFDAWNNSGSEKDLLWEDPQGWSARAQGELTHIFEDLIRGFFNFLSVPLLKELLSYELSQELERTEIQTKKKPLEETLSLPPRSALKASAPAAKASHLSLVGFVVGATTIVIGLVAGIFYSQVKSPPAAETNFVSTFEIESAIQTEIASVAPTPEAQPEPEEVKAPVPVPAPALAQAPAQKPAPTPATKKDDSALMKEVDSRFRQAMLHLKLQQSEDASREFKTVIALDANHAASYRGLGLSLVYQKDYQGAAQALRSYLKLDPKSDDRAGVEELITTLDEQAKLATPTAINQ
jgi:tetratricopeptide (TPR) repeat protein